ncbi:MAG: rhamnulokinase family protein [Acidobacteriota bacterium]
MSFSLASTYLAFDLGAESGRVFLGRLKRGLLSIQEVHRFPNEAVGYNTELHWDVPRLWLEMQRAMAKTGRMSDVRLAGIGVDAWGLDYALLGEGGTLLENPYHYRDARTQGVMERVLEVVPPEQIYAQSGIQFLPVNALYQLYAANQRTPKLLEAAKHLVTIPDLFNFWLTGRVACEFTSASCTQFYDSRNRCWATEILQRLQLPTHLLAPVIEPGTEIASLLPGIASQSGIAACPVIAPACHDTGSAVAAISSGTASAFISSGTWSLLGTETRRPVITDQARLLNFTNEGGVCGTYRVLKNILGLWLLQCCRRDWKTKGHDYSYSELCEAAASKPAFRSLIDPDDPSFLRPPDMPLAVTEFCLRTDQPVPEDPPACVRAILESLAFKYRYVLESLEQLTGRKFEEIRIVGGGVQNSLLNQFTADATGRRVTAGPIEAAAIGNIGMQALTTGAVQSLDQVREVIAGSFPVQEYEPREAGKWLQTYPRFTRYCGR